MQIFQYYLIKFVILNLPLDSSPTCSSILGS